MEDVFERDVRPLMDLIDSLRQLGVHQDVSLPQIAVMGDQSSGKSSVLHALSGVPFPKGAGLVTRCPTQLIMAKSPPGSPWKGSAHINFTSIPTSGGASSDTRKQTQPPGAGPVASPEALTDVIAGFTEHLTKGQGPAAFSTDTIVIHISAPDAPDLTIIDLPGIVRTTTKGQDAAVIAQVNALIDSYMALPHTIILAVVPANQDIATVDILERASRADPAGTRTLGVLTKPDLIGEGGEEEVVKVLCNVRKPLRLGYVMLKNASQKEANEGLSMQEARRREIAYFQSHPHFGLLPPALFGAAALATLLTRLLAAHIKVREGVEEEG